MYYKTKEEYIEDVGIICGEQDTLPFYGVEITEEEYDTLLAELEAKWEAEKPDTDPVIDSIISEVASNGY